MGKRAKGRQGNGNAIMVACCSLSTVNVAHKREREEERDKEQMDARFTYYTILPLVNVDSFVMW